MDRRQALFVITTLAGVLGLGACAGRAPSPSPTGASVYGLDWAKAAVDAGAGNPNQTTPPYTNPGSLGHPAHYQGGQADLLDVAPAAGHLVAVGYLAKNITAEAWSSEDGATWTRVVDFPAGSGSLAVAVAGTGSSALAVGRAGTSAAAWRSSNGVSWQPVDAGTAFDDPAEIQMTAVAAVGRGFVAGGWAGALRGPIRAAFWISADGVAWQRIANGGGFADARVTAIAARPDGGLLAVGIAGDAQTATGSVAWTSADGRSWTRTASAPTEGVMNGLTNAADLGWVAVGSNLQASRAMAWRSSDGSSWQAAPATPALDNYGLKIEMRDVAWTGTQLVAGGHRLFGQQFSTADVWLSSDGLTWTRAHEGAAFSQGRITAVCIGGRGLVAVGNFGAPDFSVPTVWESPPTGG